MATPKLPPIESIGPVTTSTIKEIKKLRSFPGESGETVHGIQIIMENGDAAEFWSADETRLSEFSEGSALLYSLRTITLNPGTDKERKRYKFEHFDLVIPRKFRFEARVVEKVSDLVPIAMKCATELNPIDIDVWRETATAMYEWGRNILLNENFE